MTLSRPKNVTVYADVTRFDEPARMGSLRCQTARNGDIFSFEYDPGWLQKPEAFTFDPDLALVDGLQYPAADRANFGIFLDSSPDRWGRVLMQRRENMRARREGRKARSLTEWDFLLGVHDETRLGALRFQDPHTGCFVDSDDEFAAPPSLRFVNFKRQAFNSKRTLTKKTTRTMNGGSRNCSLRGRPWAARARRPRLETKREGSVWPSFPAGKIAMTWARGNSSHIGWRLARESASHTPGHCAHPKMRTLPSS